ncbi:MAG: hypothetical protein ACR2PA_02460 [Hyphomicrobiaceae bacterium]
MAKFNVKPQSSSKIEATTQFEAVRAEDDEILEVILRVNVSEYVPDEVDLRARIDDTLFTANATKKAIRKLEQDPKVTSIAISKPLRQPTDADSSSETDATNDASDTCAVCDNQVDK